MDHIYIYVPEHSIDKRPWNLPEIPSELVNSREFQKFVEQINNSYFDPVLVIKHNRLAAGPYVGFVLYKDKTSGKIHQINIYPKIFLGGLSSEDSWKIVLKIADLYYNLGLREYDIKTALATEGNSPFIDILLDIFSNRLLNELRFGIYGEFVSTEETSSSLRGQLLVEREILKLPTQKHKFDIRYKKFTVDNFLNRVFKYTLYLGLQHTNRRETKRTLSEAWDMLKEVSLTPISVDSIEKLTLNSLNLRFELPLKLAKIIISGLDYQKGLISPGFIIPMPDAFEFFVYKLLRAILGKDYRVRYHPQNREFVLETPRKFIENPPQPDIIIESSSGQPLVVVDAKYKTLYCPKCGEKQRYVKNSSDLYQIYSYTKLYNAHAGVLVYPMLKDYSQGSGYNQYNQWLCDISSISTCKNSIFHFFDKTKLGILGINLAHLIRDSIEVSSGNITKINPKIKEQLISYLNSLIN